MTPLHIVEEFMGDEFITIADAVEKYKLNLSRLQYAIVLNRKNGLYKAIYRKRSRLYLRKDYFEAWMKTNDVVSVPRPRKSCAQTTHLQKGKGNGFMGSISSRIILTSDNIYFVTLYLVYAIL